MTNRDWVVVRRRGRLADGTTVDLFVRESQDPADPWVEPASPAVVQLWDEIVALEAALVEVLGHHDRVTHDPGCAITLPARALLGHLELAS